MLDWSLFGYQLCAVRESSSRVLPRWGSGSHNLSLGERLSVGRGALSLIRLFGSRAFHRSAVSCVFAGGRLVSGILEGMGCLVSGVLGVRGGLLRGGLVSLLLGRLSRLTSLDGDWAGSLCHGPRFLMGDLVSLLLGVRGGLLSGGFVSLLLWRLSRLTSLDGDWASSLRHSLGLVGLFCAHRQFRRKDVSLDRVGLR